jgi:hypothetical protein
MGQDEDALATKIDDLLAAGTKWVWVVRLVGPHRVDIHEPKVPARVVGIDGVLEAPGALQNPLPVRALFDHQAMRETAFANMLQQLGYKSLEELRQEGKLEGVEEGHEQGREATLRESIIDLSEAYNIAVTDDQRARLATMRLPALDALRLRIKHERRW